jgi:cell division protein FtsB
MNDESGDSRAVNIGWMGAMTRAVRWCIFAGVVGFIVAQYLPLIEKNRLLRARRERALEAETLLRERHAANLERIHGLRHDPRAVERAARERLQLARPEESIINFVEPVVAPPQAALR